MKTLLQIITGFILAGYTYLTVIIAVGHAFGKTIYPCDFFSYFRVTLIAILVGTAVTIPELFIIPKMIGRLSFGLNLLARTVLYLFFAALAVVLFSVAYYSISLSTLPWHLLRHASVVAFVKGEFLVILLLCLIVAFLINALRLIVNRFGEGVFWNYISGRYHIPHEEERIFMFLDLYASTTIAEKIGHYQYHQFLNELFTDISEPIWHNLGEIYQYVGDEVVITWPVQIGLKDAHCLKCFFEIRSVLKSKEAHYEAEYGFVPEFKAGLHAGKVIAGEVGELKTEIVFHGDTVNTASRIHSECSVYRRDFLISGDVLKLLQPYLKGQYDIEYIGHILLKGKENEIALYSIHPAIALKL
ncbi:putative adenylate/guanylate cyclase [Chloroherpeton thalassium ATCC 35110]|uniref:Putative adenylate/guanylate cyclase n=1 Tax=Chloroherpeton thalassium (strain ATCC 35110 / GB-78) TaxID=517418 RepID=B3QSX5_CHLT3|nr:adenylate/guanylate cyclase domain-containing protein [Chloroherpeton thalassium]ACF12618.1 putative adenylate/guanylate cyclase [Chloroherpeton thalassium ATCC 35110]